MSMSKRVSAMLVAIDKGMHVTEMGIPIGINRRPLIGFNNGGYINIGIKIDGTKQIFGVHQMQAYQKYGDLALLPGIQVRHLDGNSLNNSFDNIAIGTMADNARDKSMETIMRVSRIAAKAQRIFSESDILKMRQLRVNGMKLSDIGNMYDIGKGHVSDIVNYKLYSDIK